MKAYYKFTSGLLTICMTLTNFPTIWTNAQETIGIITSAGEQAQIERNAYQRIQAESYDSEEGVQTADTSNPDASASDGGVVGWTDAGDYTAYMNVNFEESSPANRIILQASNPNSTEKHILVYLDGNQENGTLISEITISGTSYWNNYQIFMQNIPDITGVHDIYLYYEEGGINLDYFYFSRDAIPEVTLMGDADNDGQFSLVDIVLLQKWLLNKSDAHLGNWKNVDFNQDNKINIFDFCLIKSELLKQIPEQMNMFRVAVNNLSVDAENASVSFAIQTQGEIPSSAWVGIVPAGTAHDEYSADKVDIVYQYIKNISDNYCTLNLPSGSEGEYELRIYDNDTGGAELYSEAFTVKRDAQMQNPEVIASNFNGYVVNNLPTSESTFTVDNTCKIYSLMTYHWNYAQGTQETGTISLLEDNRLLGTWNTSGTEGMYSTPNACWWAYPEALTLTSGHVYTIVDSDPETWSQNGGSGYAGFFEIQGNYISSVG